MTTVKKYKLIALKYSNNMYEYFKGFSDTKEILVVTEIDDALNFILQTKEDIEYYLEIVSEKCWQWSSKDTPKVCLLEMTAHIEIKETDYINNEHIKMQAVKKLSPKELEVLGLEDLGLYVNMKTSNNVSNEKIVHQYSNLLATITGIPDDTAPKQQLLNSLKGDINV